MNGGISQKARVEKSIISGYRSRCLTRQSSDDVWPLRRSDGTKLYENKGE